MTANWEDWRCNLVETGLFDWEVKPKTLLAVQNVVSAVPQEELELLSEGDLLVFAPAPQKSGQVYPWYSPPSKRGRKGVVVYLSPEIESYDQPLVDSIVVHEFAHVLLHPFDEAASPPIDREADEKIVSWGSTAAYDPSLYPDTQKVPEDA